MQLHGFLGLIPFGSTFVYDLWDTLLSEIDPEVALLVGLCKLCVFPNKLGVDCWDFNFPSSVCCYFNKT